MNYSFDYDNTLIRYKYVYNTKGDVIDAVYDKPHQENIDLLRELAEDKRNRIYIVTARTKGLSFGPHVDNAPNPEEFARVLNLPVTGVFYTNNDCKLPTLVENLISVHWDDCPEQCRVINDSGLAEAVAIRAPDGISTFLKSKFTKLLEEQI